MKKYLVTGSLLCAVWISLAAFRNAQEQVSVIGREIKDFRLPNTTGGFTSLADYPQAKGFIIVFTCNHCPFAKLYTARLNMLQQVYSRLQVPLLAVNPMDTAVYSEESMMEMKKKTRSAGFTFPYLQDASQAVAKSFQATHTPAAYVIWKSGNKWIIRYSGAIDDNGQHPEQATPFAGRAVNDLLSGKTVAQSETVSLGCAIHYKR